MMKTCPECGSTEIIHDLVVFAQGGDTGPRPIYVRLLEPESEQRPFIWKPGCATSGFRANVCGNCGHAEPFTKFPAELLAAHKQGYKSKEK